ncbi:MAG: hypothetical protein IKJ13_03890 [Clostridia bacterium]|nr:hypothetical protein [Clostridia bacterium]
MAKSEVENMANMIHKSRKALRLFVLLLSSIIVFTSCARKKPFEFMHDPSEIAKIEIVDFGYAYSENVIRASYPIEDINAFISDFKEVDCEWGGVHGYSLHNSRGIKMLYSNGDYEYITFNEVWSFDKFGDFDIVISWCFDEAQFDELLEKYSPPRDSGDITEYSFMYPETEIVKIELVDAKYRYNESFPISEKATYPIEDTESFLSDFREVECRTGGWAKWDKLIDSEARMIKISYAHGEYEYIDVDGYLQHRYYYTVEQSENYLTGPDSKCFNIEQFSALIEKYSP